VLTCGNFTAVLKPLALNRLALAWHGWFKQRLAESVDRMFLLGFADEADSVERGRSTENHETYPDERVRSFREDLRFAFQDRSTREIFLANRPDASTAAQRRQLSLFFMILLRVAFHGREREKGARLPLNEKRRK